jgi:alkylhydroperoxidase family enzyme
MALVDPLTEDGMDPDLRDHVQFFKGPLGVIPNSVRTMAHRAPIARAFTDLNVAVMTDYGAVTPEFKRLLGYVSSFASGCLYCQAHMILASERFGASEDRLNDVFDFEGSAHFTDAEKAALAFAQAATAVPNAVTTEVGDGSGRIGRPRPSSRSWGWWRCSGISTGGTTRWGRRWRTCRSTEGRDPPRRCDGMERGQASMSELAGQVRAALTSGPPAQQGQSDRMGLFSVPFRPPDGPLSDHVLKPSIAAGATRGARTARAPSHGLPGMPERAGLVFRKPSLSCSTTHGVLRPVIVQERCRRGAFCRVAWPVPKRPSALRSLEQRRDWHLRLLAGRGPEAGADRTARLGA